jgi:hypothetical protein
MYAAMSKGTIGMMRRLTTQSGLYVPPPPVEPDPSDENPVLIDSLNAE